MPSPIGHSFGGIAAWVFFRRRFRAGTLTLFALLWMASVLPDIDYYPLLWGDLRLANLNHQYFTHSLFFAVVSSIGLSIIGKWLIKGQQARVLFIPIFLAALTHIVFDYFTYDGRYPIGIPILWPLEMRFNAPVSLFGGLAKGSLSGVFSLHNLFVIAREIAVGMIILLLTFLSRRYLFPHRHQEQPRGQESG